MLMLAALALAATAPPAADVCNVKTGGGAAGDNRTDDTLAIQKTIAACRAAHPLAATVVLPGPATYRVSASIVLGSNLTLQLEAHTSLFSAITPSMPVRQAPACPTLFWAHGGTAILCGTNLTNVAIVGADEETSVLDGGGWAWYLGALANTTGWGQGPRLFEVAWSTNVTLAHVSFVNSPSWTVHPTYCRGVLAHHIRILNPRFTPNTDGFDPDSCTDVVLHDALIDTGDDGIR